MSLARGVLIVAKCNVNVSSSFFILNIPPVLIVAKCNVNKDYNINDVNIIKY